MPDLLVNFEDADWQNHQGAGKYADQFLVPLAEHSDDAINKAQTWVEEQIGRPLGEGVSFTLYRREPNNVWIEIGGG